jgi:hypothetical protein
VSSGFFVQTVQAFQDFPAVLLVPIVPASNLLDRRTKNPDESVIYRPKLAFCPVREKLLEQAQEFIAVKLHRGKNHGNRTFLGQRQSLRLAGYADTGSERAGV